MDERSAHQPPGAQDVAPRVYDELRRLAAAYMRRERPGQTLQPTALVHEVYLRLAGKEDANWENRRHFFFAASRAMRDILVDQARRKAAVKHGGGRRRIDLEGVQLAEADSARFSC